MGGLQKDCDIKRDVRKAGEEEDWKKKTRDRGGWNRLSYLDTYLSTSLRRDIKSC